MKYSRIILVFLMLLVGGVLGGFPSGASRAAAQDNTIRRAEEAFAAGRYPEAVQAYENLAERAPADATVLYNLGTAHARAGQRGMAIWRYLQALEIAPRDRETRENLQMLAPKLFTQAAIIPIPPIDWLYQHFTFNEWAAAAGGTTVTLMLMLALYFWLFSRGATLRALIRGLIPALLTLAAITWPFAVLHFYHEHAIWRGVIVSEKTVARAGPNENQTETDTLPVGTIVRIEDDSTPGWIKFSYAGGRMGFVESNRIRFLKKT